MNTYLYSLCAILAWIVALYHLRDIRHFRRDPAILTLCLSCILLALTFTISVPSAWLVIDNLSGIPNLAGLLAQGCVLLFAASVNVLLLIWSHARRVAWYKIRVRMFFFGVVLLLMVVLLWFRPATVSRPTDFVVTYAGEPFFASYLLLYVTGFGAILVETFRLCIWQITQCERPWLRRGLRLTAAGSVFGMIYCLTRFGDVIGACFGLDAHRWEVLARLGAGGGEILFLLGWTVPSVGPALSAMFGWVRRLQAYHCLYQLWAALYAANPGIALDPPPSRRADLLNLRDLDFRLYRRFIEIQDGLLVLQPHMDGTVAAVARSRAEQRGLPASRVEAIGEAARLKAALSAVNSSVMTGVRAGEVSADSVPEAVIDLEKLVDVACAFSRSPIVAAVATESTGQPVGDVNAEE